MTIADGFRFGVGVILAGLAVFAASVVVLGVAGTVMVICESVRRK